MAKSSLGWLRILGLLEGISYLALFAVTMPLKYAAELNEPNYIVGMIHGFLFVMYCLLVLIVAHKYKWAFGTTFMAGFASLLPFGTFVADARIFRKVHRRQ